jgi:hypothetical protein
VFGCLRRFIVLGILLVVVGAAWMFRDQLKQQVRAMRGLRDAPEVASPELAEVAAAKIDGLREHKTQRVALGAAELQSQVQYKYAGIFTGFVRDPTVELQGDHIRLRVRVPADKLPNVKGLGDVASFLPDTAEVQVSGTLLPLNERRVALGVDEVQAARIPLPGRLINDALTRVGRRDEPGLAKDAIGVSLPEGVRSAYIRNDSLILLGQPRN